VGGKGRRREWGEEERRGEGGEGKRRWEGEDLRESGEIILLTLQQYTCMQEALPR